MGPSGPPPLLCGVNRLTVKQVDFVGNLILRILRKAQIREIVNF